MDTPNADRFMRLLDIEYESLIKEAQLYIDTYRRHLKIHPHTEHERWVIEKEIALYEKTLRYYSKGAENGEFPTVDTTEPPVVPNSNAGSMGYIITTDDICVLGM